MNGASKKTFGAKLLDCVNDAIESSSKGKIVSSINVTAIRKRLHMSQTEFAKQYHINIKTLKQWEQGVRSPDSTGTAYLECIAKAPEQIRNILND